MTASDHPALDEDVARSLKALLHAGIKEIDAAFWSGYAHANPAVVGGYLQAGATLIAQARAAAATSPNDSAPASSGDE